MNSTVDIAVFLTLVAVATAVAMWHLHRLGLNVLGRWMVVLALGVVAIPGLFLIRDAEREERERLVSTVEGFAPVYAHELENMGHSRLRIDTPPDDPTYLAIGPLWLWRKLSSPRTPDHSVN